ncbi:hypothetical protein GN958_ATG06851 [Phytophthora infestans]|nr:hypothetical protein GN958_ATG06851 [Phytophthora infestans]
MDVRNANPTRNSKQFEERARLRLANGISNNKEPRNLSKQNSPYRRSLCRPKPPAPSSGSPAQRAAKSILKLKEGLLRLDDTNWLQDTFVQGDNALANVALAQQPVSKADAKTFEVSLTSNIEKSTRRARGPSRAKTPESIRSPSRKKNKRPPTRAERDLAEKQERLAAWLKANPETRHVSVVEDTYLPYSAEMESRFDSAMQCQISLELGVRLWDDSVCSMLAAEMTSESVFGGIVPTRALAFQSLPKQPLPATDAKPQEFKERVVDVADAESQLSDHAQKVFGTAHSQVTDGAVADAIATLQAGIRHSLSTSQARLDVASGSNGVGFNYSVVVHKWATKLQLYYRARHRRRVNRLILLQRQWRWWHARRRALKAVQFANQQVSVIQRHYRPWYTHVTRKRSAVRIQRCFRMFESQKFLIHFQRVCRLLLAQKTRRRQVKNRIRIIANIIFLFRKRRRQISLIQSLWRCRCARAQLASLLAHATELELDRRAREDSFVAGKLAQARVPFREFLDKTKRGRQLVRWQAEKPWLRFRRLRYNTQQWNALPMSDKIEAVARILSGRTFRGLQERALCQMLVGKDKQLPALPKVLKASSEELKVLETTWTDSDTAKSREVKGSGRCCPWTTVVREKMRRIRGELSRRAPTLWWAIATYPTEYCTARMRPIRQRRRELARQQLEDDFVRTLTAFLRVWFRRIDFKTNTPRHACERCCEPFATYRGLHAHDKCAAARARAKAEWAAMTSDLQFERRRKWRISKFTHNDPVRTDNYVFDLEAASVRRLRRTRSRRKALRPLVATLEACTAGDSSIAVIPLDVAAFVLQYLDDSNNLHPLMKTTEHQLVRWNKLIGSMEVESLRQTSEGSGRESRWIRQADLRSRLIVGNKWRENLSRWRRILGRRAPNYRPSPVGNELQVNRWNCVTSKWRKLQLRVRRMVLGRQDSNTAQQPTTSVAGIIDS